MKFVAAAQPAAKRLVPRLHPVPLSVDDRTDLPMYRQVGTPSDSKVVTRY